MTPDDGNELVTAIEAEFGITLAENSLTNVRTAGELHHLLMLAVEEGGAATSDSAELWDRLQKLLSRKLYNPPHQIDENTIIDRLG